MKIDRSGLEDISPSELSLLEFRNDEITVVWVNFRSTAGKQYQASHIPKDEPRITLFSKDKDCADFQKVIETMENSLGGSLEREIVDRGHDIYQGLLINRLAIDCHFNQWVAKRVEIFYAKFFADVVIDQVSLKLPLKLTLGPDGKISIYPPWEYPELENNILMAETAFENMDLGKTRDIVIKKNENDSRGDKKWKARMAFLLRGRFGEQRVRDEYSTI